MRADELDPELAAVVDEIEALGLPAWHRLSVDAARRLEDEVFSGDPEPPVADVRDLAFDGPHGEVPVRVYRPEAAVVDSPPGRVLVHFHGGGWTLGTLDSIDGPCRELATRTDSVVVSVDYRLAPEHPFPAAVKDAYAAVEWVAGTEELEAPNRVAVAGDSAGGTFSAVVSLMARDRGMPQIDAQLLLYPATCYLDPMPSRAENGSGYFLTAEDLVWFANHYVADEIDARHPYAFPLQARDLGGLPPALVVTCGYDPLRDEGYRYADRLRDDGVEVRHTNYGSMIHGFLNMEGIVDRTYDGVAEVADYLDGVF